MPSKKFLLSTAAFIAGSLLVYNGISHEKVLAEKQEAPAAKKAAQQKPRIDLAFCIDTTGSMQSEIDAVKSKTKEIVAKLSGSKPAPEIRVGLVAYRDRGDEYVTKVFQFSDNIDKVVKDISSLQADGGGDTPEAVNEALHAAVNQLEWSDSNRTVKLLFLIGDAGPNTYPNDYNWETESKKAIAKGIQINTVACGSLTNGSSEHAIFQKIAKLAEGKSEFLTYKQEVVEAGGRRSTLVSSAGRMYSVEGKSTDAWKEGASKLMARGMAAPVAAASPMPSASFAAGDSGMVAAEMAGAPAAAGFGAGFASSTASRAALPLRRAKRSAAYSYGASAAGGGGFSRAENNLADIVLSATKDAAKKKANIDYKD